MKSWEKRASPSTSVCVVRNCSLRQGYNFGSPRSCCKTFMSQVLTLELSEQVFIAIQRQAETIGISPERLAATLLEQQFTQVSKLLLNEAEKDVARARFERHFGTLKLDNLMSLNNESIDADLAREYASTHEEE